ncbi:MAG TPA: DUF480 domain-containing protein [Solirubrobacteraceae bacterium]|nr:DUF480 domain-containing protein [Solirubrobacteraceae bacterium]
MHIDTLTPAEQRVLGCLIEKRFTTPDQYPLTLNALRLACNQTTNRHPLANYDEATVRDAAQRLARYGLARLASGHSSRAVKYRHLADEALGLNQQELSLLAVLLLRGEQTPGELKARTERMASFGSLEAVDAALAALCERGYVQRVSRRPGQKEDRYRQLLGGDAERDSPAEIATPPSASAPEAAVAGSGAADPEPAHSRARPPDIEQRLDALERQVSRIAEELRSLRELGGGVA